MATNFPLVFLHLKSSSAEAAAQYLYTVGNPVIFNTLLNHTVSKNVSKMAVNRRKSANY